MKQKAGGGNCLSVLQLEKKYRSKRGSDTPMKFPLQATIRFKEWNESAGGMARYILRAMSQVQGPRGTFQKGLLRKDDEPYIGGGG
jgi:hypothetical protein